MKIKAIYKDNATDEEYPILIIACINNKNLLCMNPNGELVINYINEVRVVDEKYLGKLQEN